MLLPKKYLSISIGKEQAKIVYLSKSKYKITVYKTRELNIADCLMDDTYAQDFEKVAEVIKSALKKEGIKEKQTIFSIYHSRMITREVELPNLPKAKLEKVIGANLQDYFPVDVTDYLVGHTILETSKEDNKAKVLLVAVPQQLMSQYMTLCKHLKLDLVGIDYQENSIAHFASLQKFAGTHMLIHIGEEATTVLIGEDEKIQFTKTIPLGMKRLVEGVQKQYGYSYEVAYSTLLKQNLLKVQTTSGWEVENELKNNIRYLLNNVTSYMKYYSNQTGTHPIQEVYLTGIGGQIVGLSEYIEGELNVSTAGLELLHGVINKDKECPNLLDLGIEANIGAVFHNINLLPKELVAKAKSREQTRLVILLSILVLLSVSSILIKPIQEIKQLENESERLQEEIEAYQKIEAVKLQYDQKLQGLTLRQSLMKQADTRSDQLLEILEGLEIDMPAGITIQSLSSTESGISMNCIAEDRLTVARFISTLKTIPAMGKVYVGSISEVAGPNPEVMVIQFAVTCTYEEVTP